MNNIPANSTVVAKCNKCSAPIVMPIVWFSTLPPTPEFTCNCYPDKSPEMPWEAGLPKVGPK